MTAPRPASRRRGALFPQFGDMRDPITEKMNLAKMVEGIAKFFAKRVGSRD
jgi:hypothetical protein